MHPEMLPGLVAVAADDEGRLAAETRLDPADADGGAGAQAARLLVRQLDCELATLVAERELLARLPLVPLDRPERLADADAVQLRAVLGRQDHHAA